MHRSFICTRELSQAQEGADFALPKEAVHRFLNVLRLPDDEEVELFDGTGLLLQGKLRKSPTPHLLNISLRKKTNVVTPLVVVQAVVALSKMEQVVQRCTELGATSFVLFEAQRSEVKWKERFETKRDRLTKIAQEACRQCGRSVVPDIIGVLSLDDICTFIADFPGVSAIGDLGGQKSLGALIGSRTEEVKRGLCLIIGPEGDLSSQEFAAFQTSGAHSCVWNPHVLRSETAALAALAIVQDFFMRDVDKNEFH